MANEPLHQQSTLVMLKTVPASIVPVPGGGPVLFADSSDAGIGKTSISAKLPDGSTLRMGIIATTTVDGYMSAADKEKLDGLVAYSNATPSTAGLMSAADKTALDALSGAVIQSGRVNLVAGESPFVSATVAVSNKIFLSSWSSPEAATVKFVAGGRVFAAAGSGGGFTIHALTSDNAPSTDDESAVDWILIG